MRHEGCLTSSWITGFRTHLRTLLPDAACCRPQSSEPLGYTYPHTLSPYLRVQNDPRPSPCMARRSDIRAPSGSWTHETPSPHSSNTLLVAPTPRTRICLTNGLHTLYASWTHLAITLRPLSMTPTMDCSGLGFVTYIPTPCAVYADALFQATLPTYCTPSRAKRLANAA